MSGVGQKCTSLNCLYMNQMIGDSLTRASGGIKKAWKATVYWHDSPRLQSWLETGAEPAPSRANERSNGTISWWVPAPVGCALWFEIMISDGPPDATVAFDCVGKVGEIDLSDGSGAMVMVNEVGLQDQGRFEGTLTHTGWTWHSSNDDGHPLILDTGFSTAQLGGRGQAITPTDS